MVQRLERAAYQADRAARFYRLAEPENRLVTRQLERDWEQALAGQKRLIEELERFVVAHPRTLTPAGQRLLSGLSADIDGLWNAATTTFVDRKDIVRAVIDRIEATVIGMTDRVTVTIAWAGGATSSGRDRPPGPTAGPAVLLPAADRPDSGARSTTTAAQSTPHARHIAPAPAASVARADTAMADFMTAPGRAAGLDNRSSTRSLTRSTSALPHTSPRPAGITDGLSASCFLRESGGFVLSFPWLP